MANNFSKTIRVFILAALLSACSTTTDPIEVSMRDEICDEGDATNLNCRL